MGTVCQLLQLVTTLIKSSQTPHLSLPLPQASCHFSLLKPMGNSATVCKMSEGEADIALIGLAVMGQNLILNMNDNGFKVVAYNRTTAKVDDFLQNEAKNTDIVGAHR